MSAAVSTAFSTFAAAQHQVNIFLWSSEIAYEVMRQRVLAPYSLDNRGVHEIFGDVKCNAFVRTAKAVKAIKAGIVPKHTVKYERSVTEFESHLRLNLEPVCRFVVIRIHSALESFVWLRAEPFLSKGLTAEEVKEKKRKFQKTSYLKLQTELEKYTTLRLAILEDTALFAQTFRMLRNELVHKERRWTSPWSDMDLRKSIQTTFGVNADLVEKAICDGVKRKVQESPSTPPLFFYALFCLTRYRDFAKAVDDALPS